MKICLPVQDLRERESAISAHFGSAPGFIIYDTESGTHRTLESSNQHHAHGGCQPTGAIGEENVDVIIVGGIGVRAVQKLNAAGIRVYRAAAGSVNDNIRLFGDNQLEEMTTEGGCAGHDGGCH